MTFIPNEATATYPAQSGPDSVDFDLLLNAIRRIGLTTGCQVTAQLTPDMTLGVAIGQIEQAGTRYQVASGNVTITTANATNPRFDLVVADATGTKAVRTGTASANPVFPALTTGDVVLAAVYVPAAVTAITAGMVVDKRVLLPPTLLSAFGDGNDGVVNFDGTTTVLGMAPSGGTYSLSRDVYLDDGSQVSGTAKINTSGWKIHCRGTFTIGASASVHRNGNAGSGAGAGTGLSAVGSANGQSGGGGAGGSTAGAAGTAGTATTGSAGGSGGAGGAATGSGGTGSGTAGGAASNTTLQTMHTLLNALTVATLGSSFTGLKAGAGGSGGTSAASSTGGGGGSGGGIVWLAVQNLVNNGVISANGGAGGNGGGTGTGGGGGGGGGGGAVMLLTGSYVGTGTTTATGGAGGTPQGAGNNGAAGSVGNVYQLAA